jgi:hypothetical protein
MADGRRPSRRDFLHTAGAAMAITPVGPAAVAAFEDDPAGDFILRSQPKPEPRIILPTDALPKPDGPRKRIAAIATAYFRYSHADDIITKFIEGYAIAERTHLPHCEVVSLAIEQFPESDIGRGMAARYRIPLFGSPTGAVTLGGPKLAVDGVLLIGEHGDYPINAKGQQLYPRRRLFAEVVETFRRSGRSVPVYCDKHFSHSWADAEWMYRQSRELGFPMMAGSSVPVAWRRPPLAFRTGIPLDGALAVGFSGLEAYGFHTLELLQAFVERRRGTVTGVAAVTCLEGKAAWEAAEQGLWRADLLPAALRHVPGAEGLPKDVAACRRADPEAAVFLVEYADGFRAAAYVARRLVAEFAFVAQVSGRREPVGTWCELNKPQRDHFSFLCNHIEVMFRTGRPSYPVERTYLVTGILAALMDSRAQGGLRVRTPHLRDIRYDPAPEWTAS